MSEEKYDAAMGLLMRLDPKNLASNLQALIELEPDLAGDLLSSVDTPLSIAVDSTEEGREFLCCDYNRYGDSYRSPWSNTYLPPLPKDEAEQSPSTRDSVRELEVSINDAMDVYRDLYYEGGISSVYLWSDDESTITEGFSGVVLFKKGVESVNHWDSIHVFEAIKESAREYTYRITTTIILSLEDGQETKEERAGDASPNRSIQLTLSGSLTKQTEKTMSFQDSTEEKMFLSHITNLGSTIEDIESQTRNLLEIVYFDKSRDIYHEVRNSAAAKDKLNKSKHQQMIRGLQGL